MHRTQLAHRRSRLALRQQDPECAPETRLTVNADRAPVTTHDAEHCGHAKPSPGELRAEEGIEDPGASRLVHPNARVVHLEEDIGTFGQILSQARLQEISARAVRLTGSNDDPATPIPECLGGVRHEVQQYLAQLAWVAFHGADALREVQLEGRLLGYRYRQQLRHSSDQLRQIDGFQGGGNMARVSEKECRE